MRDCLVEIVESSVDNNNLDYFGYITLTTTGTKDNNYCLFNLKENGVIKALDGKTFINDQTEVNMVANVDNGSFIKQLSEGEVFRCVIPKYTIARFVVMNNMHLKSLQELKITSSNLKRFYIQGAVGDEGLITGLNLSNCTEELILNSDESHFVFGDLDTIQCPSTCSNVRLVIDADKSVGSVNNFLRIISPYITLLHKGELTANIENLAGNTTIKSIIIYGVDGKPSSNITGNIVTGLRDSKILQECNLFSATGLYGNLNIVLDQWVSGGRNSGYCRFSFQRSANNVTLNGEPVTANSPFFIDFSSSYTSGWRLRE